MLLSAGQEDAHGKLRVFLRRFVHGLLQAVEILSAQTMEVLRLGGVHHRMAVLGRLIPVGNIHQPGKRVKFKLDPAVAGGKKVDALLHGLQHMLHPPVFRHISLREDLVRQAVDLRPVGMLLSGELGSRTEPGCDLQQAFQQQRVERAALAVEDHLDRRILLDGLFVAPLVCQRVVDIRQRHHLRGNGDLLSPQPIRVAVSVPALMVPAADLHRVAEQGLVLSIGHVLQDPRTGGRVILHDRKFLRRQLAGLVQDLLRRGDLADVMQGGRRFDEVDILLGERIDVRLPHQLAKQQLRNGTDAADMVSALVVAEFHHAAENSDHQIVVFLFFIDLRGNQVHQPLLVGVESEGIFYPVTHDKRVKGSMDEIRDP